MSNRGEIKWIDKARFAFTELAEGEDDLVMNRENWLISRFRFLVSDREQTTEEMNKYFDEMDSNGDGVLTWNEIINFLLKKQGEKLITNAKHIDIQCVHPTNSSLAAPIDYKPIDSIYIEQFDKFISFSDRQIISFNAETMKQTFVFVTPGIVAMCYSDGLEKVIFIKGNCEIIFMDPETDKLDSFKLESIGENGQKEVPTSIAAFPYTSIILLGHQSGKIGAISLDISEDNVLSADLLKVLDHHTAAVTGIIWIEQEDCFASCSDDGTIVMFNINISDFECKIVSQFKIPRDVRIRTILYDPVADDIFFATKESLFGRWRPKTSNYKTVDVGETTVTSISSIEISKRKSMIVAITDDRFFWMFKQPEFIMVGCWKMDDYHLEQPATVVRAVDSNIFVFGSYISKWTIELSLKAEQTFVNNIAGAAVFPTIDTIIGIDDKALLLKWKLETGQELAKLNITFGVRVNSFTTDDTGKKLTIALSDGILYVLNAATLQYLSRIDLGEKGDGIIDAKLTTLCGASRLALVFDNQVQVFNETPDSKLIPVRIYKDHKNKIFRLDVLKKKYILTCAEDGENIIFDYSSRNTKFNVTIPEKITGVCDIPASPTRYLISDDRGNIHLMSVDKPEPIYTMDVFGLNMECPITSIHAEGSTIAIANKMGYIKTFNYNRGLIETSRFRAHYGNILKVEVFSESYLYTIGEDHRILIFALSPPRFVGAIGDRRNYYLLAPSTWRNPEEFCQQEISHFVNSNKRMIYFETLDRNELKEERSVALSKKNELTAPSAFYSAVNMVNALDLGIIPKNDNDRPETARFSRPKPLKSLASTRL